MKSRRINRPVAFVTRPARAVGIAPRSRRPAMTFLGPYLSQSDPEISRTNSVEVRARTLDIWTSSWVRLRSFEIVARIGGKANQEKKATKNPSQDRWKFRAYLSRRLKIGRVNALRFLALIEAGAN